MDLGISPPARSPGLRLGGLGARSPAIAEESTSPLGESKALPLTGAGGVKRTKSLMQKIKTMVRTRSGSVDLEQDGGYFAGMQSGEGGRGGRYSSGEGGQARPVLTPTWTRQEILEEAMESPIEEDYEVVEARAGDYGRRAQIQDERESARPGQYRQR